MKYPNIVNKSQRAQLIKDNGKAQARLYAESESLNEFRLKRDVAGLKHAILKFDDYFNMFYFYANGRRKLYYATDWAFPLHYMIGLSSLVFLIAFGITFSAGHTIPAISLIAIASFSISLNVIYIRSVRAARMAKYFLDDINCKQKYDL